jgi:diadenosine tetraphosphate (Ap4A) HIT family hydrolase
VVVDGVWRVAHAFNSALPGWLVVVPTRHVTALEDLTAEEVEPLGPLLRRCSLALRSTTGSLKSYLMFFAEAAGFEHLHIHVVPRPADLTPAQLGPGVFDFLARPEPEWVSETERDQLALDLRRAMRSEQDGGATQRA